MSNPRCLKGMLLIWLVGGFCLVVSNSFSQAKVSRKDIDRQYESALDLWSVGIDTFFVEVNSIYRQSEEIGYPLGETKGKLFAAYYFFNIRQLDTAKLLLADCREFYHTHDRNIDRLGFGRMWLYSGFVASRESKYRLAKSNSLDALQLFSEINDTQYIGKTLNLLGSIEWGMNNFPQSLEYFTAAYKARIEGGENDEDCLLELTNIADTYNRMGQFDDALKYAHKVRRYAERSGNIEVEINILNNIGLIHSSKTDLDSARIYYEMCSGLARRHNIQSKAFLARYNLANLYSGAGLYNESIKITKELLADSSQAYPAMLTVYRSLLAKNYLRTENYDSSIIVALPLYLKARSSNGKQMAINTAEILWKAYQKKNKYDSAFRYLLAFQQLKDSVYSLENQRALSKSYAEMENLEKQHEIEHLQDEREIEATRSRNVYLTLGSGFVIAVMGTIGLYYYYRNKVNRHRRRNIELENELTQRKNDLHTQARRIIDINNALLEIEGRIREISSSQLNNKEVSIEKILNSIELGKSLAKEWEHFNDYFNRVHMSFVDKIDSRYPSLTIAEKRLASLIKIDLSNQEIAAIINVDPKSVKQAKYRLKKKFQLGEKQDISDFLHELN